MAAPVFPAAPVPLASRAVPATFSADNDAALVWEKAFRDVLAASIPFYEGTVTDSEQAVTDAEAQVALAVEQVALAVEQVGLAEDEVAEAVAQVELAGAQRVLAQAAAAAAIVTANAPLWVSEASYTVGANVISPIDFGTYRAILPHTGQTTDPSADATNWVLISAPAKATQVKAEAGTDNDDFMTSLRTAQAIAALASGGGLVPIGTKQTLSAVAAADILLTGGYNEYVIKFWGFQPATDDVALLLRTSTDGGSTFDSGAAHYSRTLQGFTSAAAVYFDVADAQILVAGNSVTTGVINTTNYRVSGELRIFQPGETSRTAVSIQSFFCRNASLGLSSGFGNGVRLATADVDAVRLFFNSGNITSGQYQLYGVAVG